MNFPEPLKPGIVRRRYKRFFAEIEFEGTTLTAHVPNTGTLKGCWNDDAPCLFSTSNDPTRKLAHTLQMIQDDGTWVGINTHLANQLVWEAWQGGTIAAWKKFDGAQREVKIHAKTRIDMALWKISTELPVGTKLTSAHLAKNKFHFVEVKNVTMSHGGFAMFPDCETERGQKHLRELIELAGQGHKTEIFFLVQRSDCQAFAPADNIDPLYGQLLRQAIKTGVKITAHACDLSATGITVKPKPMAFEI